MYFILLEAPSVGLDEQERPHPVNPRLCQRVVQETLSVSASDLLEFQAGPTSLEYDYLSVYTVSGGYLVSQRFLDVLSDLAVPVRAYPVRLLHYQMAVPFPDPAFLWVPQRVRRDEAVDMEQSEIQVNQRTGLRRLVRMVLRPAFLEHAPLIFATMGRCLVHETVRQVMEEQGLRGIAFASLDAVDNPEAEIKRRDLEALLQAHPDDWSHWYQLSLLYKDERALAPLRRALDLNPNAEHAWYRLGGILRTIGSREEALQAFQRAIDLNPQSGAWGEYAAILRELGKYEEALTVAQRWVEIWGEISPLPWYEVGKAQAALDRDEAALAAFDRGFAVFGAAVGGRIHEVHAIRAEIFFRQGRYEEALKAYEAGLVKNHFDQQLWEGKAKTLWALGDEAGARDAEQKARQIEDERKENARRVL